MHTLIVGGTGMLAGVTRHFAGRGGIVSLLARHPGTSPGISPLAVDYNDEGRLVSALRQAIALHGPISRVIAWMSSARPGVLQRIVDEVAAPVQPFRLFLVRGSRAADPAVAPRPALAEVPALCACRQIILGFVIEGDRSRWLTHAEIAAGVIEAVAADRVETIVGLVRPWSMRP